MRVTTFTSTFSKLRPLLRALAVCAVILVAAIVAYIVSVASGMRAAAQTNGRINGLPLRAPVLVLRDERGIPHIRAANEHDLFFAQGFAEASDRLFQMDLLRRYAFGRLSEVLGPAALAADERTREVDVRGLAFDEYRASSPRLRDELAAFSDGVNAAMTTQPIPVEFRALLYRPDPWRPEDAIAVGFATVFDLIDKWTDIEARSDVIAHAPSVLRDALFSPSDARYDVPLVGGAPAADPTLPPIAPHSVVAIQPFPDTAPIGSNEWAAGAARTATHRALLANDPHLRLQVPEIWYLVDLSAPGFHASGGAFAGTPGVILGHNDRIAWGATNATVVTEVAYERTRAIARRDEVFHVRFRSAVRRSYERDGHGFFSGSRITVDWPLEQNRQSPLASFDALDRARSVADGIRVLHAYNGPPQNFALADASGNVGYVMAGPVPNDPSWGLRIHAARDPHYAVIPANDLPHVEPARMGVLFTANNRVYGRAYRYRLTPNFAPPYRANRIHQLLARTKLPDVQTFWRMGDDVESIPEFELAKDAVAAVRQCGTGMDAAVARLREWDGRFDSASAAAPLAFRLRQIALSKFDTAVVGQRAGEYHDAANGADLMLLMRALRERPRGYVAGGWDRFLCEALRQAAAQTANGAAWSEAGTTTVRHALAALGLTFLNGRTLPGNGDSYAVHVQAGAHAQSFRAVWDVGNWDAGGMTIPSGESGEPGSGHYTDLTGDWIAGRLRALPFSDRAVASHARDRLVLMP